jgi:hypothetical protein
VNKARNDPGISIRATLREVYATILEHNSPTLEDYDRQKGKAEYYRKRGDDYKQALDSKERLCQTQQKVIAELYAQLHPKSEAKPSPVDAIAAMGHSPNADWRTVVEAENGVTSRRK